jgi:FkbM family methyltransferase
METHDWIIKYYHEHEKINLMAVKVGDIVSYNDGDVCISVVTHEQLQKHTDPICIDVGADIGWWTSFCLKQSDGKAQIYAFEPNPKSFEELTALFKGGSNVHLFNKAVSDSSNQQLLFDFNGPLSNSRKNGAHAVVTTTLDFIFDAHPRIHLLKIDTEGHEPTILKALCKYLGKIDSIIFEFTPRWHDGQKREAVKEFHTLFMDLISEYGCIYTISRRGIPVLKRICSEDDLYHFIMSGWSQSTQTDIFCCRGEVHSVQIEEYTP